MTTAKSPAYEVLLSRSAVSAQKKLDKPLRLLLKQALERLATNPTGLGEQLKQPLTMLRSHHVRYKGLEWRIGYQLNEEAHVIYVVLIGPHENFYRTLKNCLSSLALGRVG
ncbi:MAG: type II toxin-antitoxin system RelE/ParE family toxin [Vampirovibrionales bacterium]|jgi:mRNA-degrading endonuclease RelE of RelBE toxin-antitoxin system